MQLALLAGQPHTAVFEDTSSAEHQHGFKSHFDHFLEVEHGQ